MSDHLLNQIARLSSENAQLRADLATAMRLAKVFRDSVRWGYRTVAELSAEEEFTALEKRLGR